VSGPRISVCVVCRNEADKLVDCLESARWADEVLVMDLESDDDSAAVATRLGARVVPRARVPIVELVRNEIAAEATGEWILALDPDERVTPGLAAELRAASVRDDIDVVTIPVMNHDFGHPAATPVHRYDPKPRMYRKDVVRWPTEPNELPQAEPGRVYAVPSRDELVLVHDRNRTIVEALERVLRYAPAEAEALLASGETFTARKMLRRAGSKAYKQFVVARSLEEGVPGLVRAFVLASFHFYVWACFWQLSGGKNTEADRRYLRRLALPLRLLPPRLALGGRARAAARRVRA
jgi:glycosyltransferase involved in cell wall biosynthesis